MNKDVIVIGNDFMVVDYEQLAKEKWKNNKENWLPWNKMSIEAQVLEIETIEKEILIKISLQ